MPDPYSAATRLFRRSLLRCGRFGDGRLGGGNFRGGLGGGIGRRCRGRYFRWRGGGRWGLDGRGNARQLSVADGAAGHKVAALQLGIAGRVGQERQFLLHLLTAARAV